MEEMEAEDRPTWLRALAHLEEGRRDEARAILSRPDGASDAPADLRLAELLGMVLDGGSGPPPVSRDAGPSSPDDRLRLARTLEETAVARRAVREGRVDDLVRHARAAVDHAPEPWVWPRLYVASVLQAGFRFSGDTDLRDRGLAVAAAAADRIDRPAMAVLARGILATFHVLSGRLHAMAERCRAAIDLARATGLQDHPFAGMAHQFLGYALFEWNRLDQARAELERAWSLAGPDRAGIRSGVARTMTSLCAAEDRAEEAARWFGRLEEIVAEPMTLRNREWLAAVRIRHGFQTDRDLRAMDAWRQGWDYRTSGLDALDDGAILSRLHEYDHLLVLLEATAQWEALRAVAEAVARAAGDVRPWFTLRARTAEAVALEGLGRDREADALWAEALVLGAPEHFVRVFIEGDPLRLRLLRRALADPTTCDEARRVVEAAGPGAAHELTGPSLTPRQLQVLEHLAEGLSNRQIAHRMDVAETTVRTHLRDVYARLDVGSRTAAVARGRELGMV